MKSNPLAALLVLLLTLVATHAYAVPTVSITAPTANQKFGTPVNITLKATATPSSGTTITKVEFFRGGTTLIGTATTSPYQFVWNNVAIGTYSITAKATDSANGTKTSTAVSITVQANALPTVSISLTSPPTSNIYGFGQTVNMSSTATDTDGTISKVDFLAGTTVIGTDATSPYSFSWVPSAAGPYSLTAKATDNSGGVKQSTAVSITVLAAPTVNLTAPADGARFDPNSTITLSATASAATNATISKVEFFRGGTTLIGSKTAAPYTFNWLNVPAGSYAITAKATDSKTGTKTTAPVNITVAVAQNPPQLTITSPASGTLVDASGSVTLTTSITAASAAISKVDYYVNNGATPIGTATTAPYSFTWTNIPSGAFQIVAKATDTQSQVGTSPPIQVIAEIADSCTSAPPLTAAEQATKLAQFGKLPLLFEKNLGQFDERVKYAARGRDYQIFLTEQASVVALHSTEGRNAAVRFAFVDAKTNPSLRGEEPSATRTNYFVGGELNARHSAVPNFGTVRYASVYPGIDAVYHTRQGELEYDLHVAPRGNPDVVKIAFEGVDEAFVDEQGDLVMQTAAGTIRHRKPVAYQEVDGERINVPARYRLLKGNELAFELSAYDRERSLVIDPVLVYSTLLGGTAGDSGINAMVLSRCGEAFLGGWTNATDFPTTPGAYNPNAVAGGQMGFVAKLNPAGTALMYSTFFIGTHYDSTKWTKPFVNVTGMAVDGSGHVFITGDTGLTDFPLTPNNLGVQPSTSSSTGIVAKLSRDGSALAYSSYINLFGGGWTRVAIDGASNAFVINGGTVQKVSPDATRILYTFGQAGIDQITDVASDAAGNAYVTGYTHSAAFPATPGAFQTTRTNSGSFDTGFVTKVKPDGSGVVFSTYLGTTGDVMPRAIALDDANNVYIAGNADAGGFPFVVGGRTFTQDSSATKYAFAARLSADGSQLDFFSRVGGLFCTTTCSQASTDGDAIAVDASKRVWFAGATASNKLPLVKSMFPAPASGGSNFAIKLSADGNTMLFGTLLDGTTIGGPTGLGTNASAIRVDAVGSAYVAGWTDKSDFPTTSGAYQMAPRGSAVPNAFIAKINETKDSSTTLSVTPTFGHAGDPITLKATVTGNTPTGNVTFLDGTTPVGTAAVNAGTAQLVTSTISGGTHTLTASYAGDSANLASTSSPVTLILDSPTASPTVTVTGIADGAALTTNSGTTLTGQQVTLSATAAGGNRLTEVDVYPDGSTIFFRPGTETFSQVVTLGALSVGSHFIYGGATDNFGHSVQSPLIRFTVNSPGATPPTVTVTSPADGATLQLPGQFPVAATATPAGSATISSLSFDDGAGHIISGFNGPPNYTGTWNPGSGGTYRLVATATDSNGATGISAPITVTVLPPPPPTVSITSPANGATFTTPSVTITADAAPPPGGVLNRVEFFDGTALIGTKTAPPYTITWASATSGTHKLTARATDGHAISATSSPVTITVNLPPGSFVNITSPQNGTTLFAPAEFKYVATASPPAGTTVTRVEVLANGELVGNSLTGTWSEIILGNYSLTIRAYDSGGGIGLASVNVVLSASATITFVHNDFAGNPIIGTNSSGTVLWKENYAPFGQRQVNAGAAANNRQWFGDKYEDLDAKLSYFGARYYDPAVGRFMAVDPAGFEPSNLQSFNRFAYGNNNPYRYRDSDGRVAVPAAILEGTIIIGGLYLLNCKSCQEHLVQGARWVKNLILNESADSGEAKAGNNSDGRGQKGEIERGQQDKHIPGTNENKTGGEGKSTWADPSEADKLTEEARSKGEVVQTRPDGSSVIKWDAGRVVGAQGQTQVTVHVRPKGSHHGHPSGPTE